MSGNGTYWHFALRDATALAIARANANWITAVAVRNSEYAGCLAPLCEEAANAGVSTLVFDFTTSAVASGRLAEERDRGTPLPDEWVNPEGLAKPFGGFKGFGPALLLEALGGALSGSEAVSERKLHMPEVAQGR